MEGGGRPPLIEENRDSGNHTVEGILSGKYNRDLRRSSGTETNPDLTPIAECDIPIGPLRFCDSIAIKNYVRTLYLGVDPWRRDNHSDQIVNVSVRVWRKQGCPMTVSKRDDEAGKLEVNYSQLARTISTAFETLTASRELAEQHALHHFVEILWREISQRAVDNDWKICAMHIKADLPKATHTGDCLSLELWREPNLGDANPKLNSSMVLCFQGLRLNASIGFHAFEHQAKQRLIITLWIDTVDGGKPHGPSRALLNHIQELETVVVKFVETTIFKTLEGMGNELLALVKQRLGDSFAPDMAPNLRLRIEKPLAVPLADAPMVELYRPWIRPEGLGSVEDGQSGKKQKV
ncbi:hypothetical protein P152DRAFT_460036 [Eremomyces bilateralis CBS 781.70]|uniref:Dihydroneopterin aldolase/epimerase domain-containing protein n=1 Tax=Eremomyces bilateralis CBS 781.70 TaxID=1392243 RepID=A0A6G1FYI7_9PEZI|nr:uncharacterized protein P152DRAFT_460036 [Eremomyces bilateralis CBS 781.70]KAF1810736.1 hypothetical protein P152DRAFT_460036 [Eremomyces bilateralis CBS 781.70]